jgi:hypothetical protein
VSNGDTYTGSGHIRTVREVLRLHMWERWALAQEHQHDLRDAPATGEMRAVAASDVANYVTLSSAN